jgi:hypothetical protein
MNGNYILFIFSKSKGHNSVKNGLIVPKTEFDLDILMINLYTKYNFNMCSQCEENERKLQIIGNFKSKGHTSVKYGSIVSKIELDLDILMIILYTKYHFNMCSQCEENEQKLQIIGIFLSPRVIPLSNMARLYPK